MSSINIAIVGCISSGKSTLLNAIFVEQYSNMRIKRDTMVPQVYKETNDESLFKSKNDILKENSSINQKFQVDSESEFTKEDCVEIIHNIPKNENFINMPDNIFINYYDIPGLNDCSTKDIYYEWFGDNFYKFDIIIYIVDINSAMNTSDERDILNKVKENIITMKRNEGRNIKLIVLVNKCDDLVFTDDNSEFKCGDDYFTLDDDELNDMYQQIITVFATNLKDTEIDYELIPISAIDIFVYRHLQNKPDIELDVKLLNKFGENEFGKRKWKKMTLKEKKKKIHEHFTDEDNYIDALKNTGFNNIIDTIKDVLNTDNQYKIFSNKIVYKLNKLKNYNDFENIDNLIEVYESLYVKITNINKIYKQDTELYTMFIINIVDNIKYLIVNYFKLKNDTFEELEILNTYKNLINKFYINDDIINYEFKQDDIILDKELSYIEFENIEELLDNTITVLSDLQNEYYTKEINIYEDAYTNFPITLIDNYLEKLIENDYDNWEELFDNIFTLCFNQEDIDCDFNKIYFEHEEENRLIKFCKYVHSHYEYPLTKIMDNLEKWLLKRYIIYREIEDEDNKYGVIYPYLINSKLTVNNFYKEDKNPFYNKLYIMNLGAVLFDLEIKDLELIEEEDLILQVFNYYRETYKENLELNIKKDGVILNIEDTHYEDDEEYGDEVYHSSE